MTSIRCITPNKLELTLNIEDLPFDATEHQVADWFERVLSVDRWLATHGFTPVPIAKSGGGNWNGGKANNTPRHWIDADGDLIYVFIAYVESKEKTAELKKEWGAKLKAATGLGYEVDKNKFKDDKGREQWVWVFPKTAWRGIVDTLPETEFEYKQAFKTRVEAALAKAQA